MSDTNPYAQSLALQMRAWLGKDALRSAAGRMLDEYQLRPELDDELIALVLAHFHADAMPVEGVDYLAEPESVPSSQMFPPADVLRLFVGRWIAVTAGVVVQDADTQSELLDRLSKRQMEAHSMFRVPTAEEAVTS